MEKLSNADAKNKLDNNFERENGVHSPSTFKGMLCYAEGLLNNQIGYYDYVVEFVTIV